MSERLRCYYYTSLSERYELSIDDDEYVGSPVEVNILSPGPIISWEGDEDDPFTQILTSSVEFTIISDEDVSDDLNDFIADLLISDETRFRVVIRKDSGDMYWAGFVLTDGINKQDEDWKQDFFEFEIKAIDPIGRLAKIDYFDDGTPYSGRVTYKEHIFNILNKMGVSDLWGGTDDFLYVICRWYETDMDSIALSTNPLDHCYVDHEVFLEKDEDGNITYTSCLDVIKELSLPFLMRFFLSDGKFNWQQIGEYRESTVSVHRYRTNATKTGTALGQSLVVQENTSANFRYIGGIKSYFAAVRKVNLTYNHFDDTNLLKGASFNSNASPSFSTAFIDFEEGYRLKISGILFHYATSSSGIDNFYMKFGLTLQVEPVAASDQYLNRDVEFSGLNNFAYTNPAWGSAAEEYVLLATMSQINGQELYTGVEFITPPIGFDYSASIVLDFRLIEVVDITGQVIATTSSGFNFYGVSCIVIKDDLSTQYEKTTYSQTSDVSPNASLVLDYETTIFSGTNGASVGRITIDGSTMPEPAEQWIKGTTGSGTLHRNLWLAELMKVRAKPTARFVVSFLSAQYDPSKTYAIIDATVYAFLRGRYITGVDRWECEFFFVGHTDTIVSTEGPVIETPLPPVPGPGIIYNPLKGLILQDAPSVPLSWDNGGNVVAVTDEPIVKGDLVTEIPITPIGVDGLINSGDTVAIINSVTGQSQVFTVANDVGVADEAIDVVDDTADFNFISSSIVTLPTDLYVGNIRDEITSGGTISCYREQFTVTGTDTVTVTENGGVLPIDNACIQVFHDGMYIIGWTKSGSDITLPYNIRSGTVTVDFKIVSTISCYREQFTVTGTDTVTVTENGGVLPIDNACIQVFHDGMYIIGWTKSGSDITLPYNIRSGTVTVDFVD